MQLYRSMKNILLYGILVPYLSGCTTTTQSSEVNDSVADPAHSIEHPKLIIEEWTVPWPNTRPRDPDVAPNGDVWFVGQQGDYLAKFDPKSGEMKHFDLQEGAGPHTVIVDKQGYPWYAGNRDRHIGRLDPKTGEVTRYELPEGINDPHTMAWTSDGDIWFTVQRSKPAGYIGLLSPESGKVAIVPVPGEDMRPYGLVVDRNDRPWIAFMGKNAIGTVDPKSMKLEIIETPHKDSQIRRLSVADDGRIWWVDAAAGYVGVYDPKDRTMRQWQSPGGASAELYATTIDHKQRLWYVEAGPSPNKFIAFDTKEEKLVAEIAIPSGAGSVRNMTFDEESHTIWFGTDADTIGRAIPR
ncbi:MAG: virginiamycin B lyase family protein [Oligoflexus sp.]